MTTAPAGRGGDAALDRLDQLAGRPQRTGGDDLGRDATGEALLAVARDERGEVGLGVLVDDVSAVSVCTLSMRMSSGAASAQYEKPRTGRSSCGLLTPRSNKIATIPSFPTMSAFPTISATLLEAALHDADPVPEGCECRARRCHGDGVPVDAEETEVGSGA